MKRLAQVVLSIALQGAILFVASGRLDWVMAWVFIGVSVAVLIVNSILILPKHPDLVAERASLQRDAKRWDKVLGVFVAGVLPVVLLTVAGLDKRFAWSPQVPVALQVAVLVLLVLGYALVSWAMVANRFFSCLVRVQKERGHTVASGGPYRFVRHPSYMGMMTFWLAIPLVLGSLWALVATALIWVGFVVRTIFEDRTLMEELDGYRDYAQRVWYRLVPGLW